MKRYFSPLDAAVDSLNSITQQQAAWARRLDQRHQSLLQRVRDELIDYKEDMPLMHMLLHSFDRISDVRERLNVVDDFKEILADVLKRKGKTEDEIKDILNDYAALRHYVDFIDDLVRDDKIKEIYNQHIYSSESSLNLDAKLYYFILENNHYSEEFLWLAQTLYYYAHYQEEIVLDAVEVPIYTYKFKDKMIHPAPFFCLSLLEAARFRRRVLEGIDEPFSVKDFPLEIRNACFDSYIQHETEQRLKALKTNFDRPLEPTTEEAQMEFLKDELLVYDEAKNDPEISEDVLRMTELFVAYLKNEIGIEEESHKREQYCIYSVPNAPITRDEIEAELVRVASLGNVQRFVKRLLVFNKNGYLDFMEDTPREIYEYMKERYNLNCTDDHFIRCFRQE